MKDKFKVKNEESIKKVLIIEPEYQAILNLYEARTELGITQKELSKLSGVRQSNISRIESGACSPTIHTLSTLALAMNKKLEIKFK